MKRTLIDELTELQTAHGWLRREDLEALSRRTDRPLYELQGLLSFYPHFRTEPPRRHEVTLCRDLSCHLAGGEAGGEAVGAALRDRDDASVRWVSCIGRCDSAPAATVNDHPCRTGEVIDIVAGAEPPPVEAVSPPPGGWPTDPYASRHEHYGTYRRAIAGEVAAAHIVEQLKASGLRGMGGAGFPTGSKWELVAAEPDAIKFVVCNADESEPGTFKDREILRQLPHLVLEGMLLGMHVVGSREAIVFVRHEYGPEADAFALELERARSLGLLNGDGAGDRSVEIFTSPGGYILGEETALLECLEGKRGEPRNKPPFPGTKGLWGKPTLINNVETFHHVPGIVALGVDGWNGSGLRGHAGYKFISVSGDVERPGVHCIPMGTTVGELIDRCGGVSGGRPLLGFAPGGASSNFMLGDRADVELDFASLQEAGSMLGSGALVVVAEGSDLLALATNVLAFFSNESCGKCVPCRVGSRKAVEMMRDVLSGAGADGWERTVEELEETLRLTSICGLGQVALGPVLSVLHMRGTPEPAPMR